MPACSQSFVPMPQPRNVFFGHVVSAFVGVSWSHITSERWVACAGAVATAVIAMEILGCTHPPVRESILLKRKTGLPLNAVPAY